MRQVAIQSRALLRTAILASLAALGWFAPTRVEASCGDYVTIVPHGAVPMQHRMPISGHTPATQGQDIPTNFTPRHAPDRLGSTQHVPLPSAPCRQCPFDPANPGNAPCQGPWCSGNHGPLTVPATTHESPREDSAVCGSVPRVGDAKPIPHAFLDDQAARIHHVVPIYHPPRSV
jgi:hypothetical protein